MSGRAEKSLGFGVRLRSADVQEPASAAEPMDAAVAGPGGEHLAFQGDGSAGRDAFNAIAVDDVHPGIDASGPAGCLLLIEALDPVAGETDSAEA